VQNLVKFKNLPLTSATVSTLRPRGSAPVQKLQEIFSVISKQKSPKSLTGFWGFFVGWLDLVGVNWT
jgi:hypothetical protein